MTTHNLDRISMTLAERALFDALFRAYGCEGAQLILRHVQALWSLAPDQALDIPETLHYHPRDWDNERIWSFEEDLFRFRLINSAQDAGRLAVEAAVETSVAFADGLLARLLPREAGK